MLGWNVCAVSTFIWDEWCWSVSLVLREDFVDFMKENNYSHIGRTEHSHNPCSKLSEACQLFKVWKETRYPHFKIFYLKSDHQAELIACSNGSNPQVNSSLLLSPFPLISWVSRRALGLRIYRKTDGSFHNVFSSCTFWAWKGFCCKLNSVSFHSPLCKNTAIPISLETLALLRPLSFFSCFLSEEH